MSSDRRRSPRIEILERIHGHVASLDVAVRVLEMSLGGMGLETTFAFPVGAVHEFRLTLGDGSNVIMRGKVLRSREHIDAEGRRVYISGVQFLDDDPPAGDSSVGDLIDKIT
jgi:hypothetical protein